jgi:hypothetical protein
MQPHPSGQNCRTAQIASHPRRITPVNHRQSADVSLQHLGQRRLERFIRMGHHELSRTGLDHGQVRTRVVLQRSKHVAAGDDARQALLRIDQEDALMPGQGDVSRRQAPGQFAKLHRGGNQADRPVHHVADSDHLQGIDTVFAGDVLAPAGELHR